MAGREEFVDLTLDASDDDLPEVPLWAAAGAGPRSRGAVPAGLPPGTLQAERLPAVDLPRAPTTVPAQSGHDTLRVDPARPAEPSQSQHGAATRQDDAGDVAPPHGQGRRGGGAKPKRTREQIAQDAEERRQRKAAEAKTRKEQRDYDSDRNVLKYLTVLLDPEFMSQPLGLEIAKAFQATQAKLEHERIAYRVVPTGLLNLPALRWQRKVPAEAGVEARAEDAPEVCRFGSFDLATGSTGCDGSGRGSGGGSALVDSDEPHVMLCFEAEAFVAHVMRDSMRSVFAQLERHCPGMRPHFVVHRLAQHLQQRERSEHRAAMQAGAQGQGFSRRPVDDFVARLAVECPSATFREVRSGDEAAVHACTTTVAIARRFTQKTDAAKYLAAQGGGGKKAGQSMAALLAAHPVEDPGARACMAALCALPAVGPQIAHAVTGRHGSLGALMDALFDPGTSRAQKQSALERMARVGPARSTQVGPKAARQLLELLTCEDPDVLVHREAD